MRDSDLVLLVDERGNEYVIRLQVGGRFDTNQGFIRHDDLIGKPWGTVALSSTGAPFLVARPSTADLIRHIKRSSQVIFPKDSAYILMRLNVKPGARVLESGCGSGGLTLALATAVMPHGRVYSQEIRQDFIELAQRNMTRVGLQDYVTFIHGDGREGFQVDAPVDAVFLDMPQPETCVHTARAALKEGGFFGALVPTTNQVSNLLRALNQAAFGLVEVEEILLRRYKPVPDRLRPQDRMIAHTGYLIFARAMERPLPAEGASRDAALASSGADDDEDGA